MKLGERWDNPTLQDMEFDLEIIRSLIFVPGNRINMIEKALDFNADIIMYD